MNLEFTSKINAVVTTVRKENSDLIDKAKSIANQLDIKYIKRNNVGIAKIKEEYRTNYVIIIKKDKIVLDLPEGEMFFHPNMAQVRIKRLRYGGNDNMLDAMQLEKGMSVLDCTLGFAADAIVSSYATGERGKVVGLEINPLIALTVQDGLKNYLPSNYDIKAAMERIEVINQDYFSFLQSQKDNSFDIVYFDPMFRHPLTDSKNLKPLRELADKNAVSIETIKEAMRVAKYRVIFKENSRSLEFSRLGFNQICGGKYAPIHYGVKTKDTYKYIMR